MLDDNPFSRLTARQMRVVVMLSYGWTQAEIAKSIGVSRSAVCQRICNARKRLGATFAKP
jgi:DNA-binding NarL/FixJ family response regulator